MSLLVIAGDRQKRKFGTEVPFAFSFFPGKTGRAT